VDELRPQVGRGKGTGEVSTFVHILAVPYFDSIYSPNLLMSPLGIPIQCLVQCVRRIVLILAGPSVPLIKLGCSGECEPWKPARSSLYPRKSPSNT
jgi:hypothetical protein